MANASEEKIDLTFGMVVGALKLSKLQIRTLFLTILQNDPPAEQTPLSDEVVNFLLIADLLEKAAFLRPEQRTLILTNLWQRLLSQPGPEEGLHQLLFADEQYCTWTGQTGFLDIDSGDHVPAPPHPIMESIGYNLTELYRRGRGYIEKRSGLHVKKSNAGSVDEQGNIRRSAANDVSGSLRLGGPDVGPDDDRA
jgi:hypothetical protein